MLSTRKRDVSRRSSVLLFPYSFLLGLIALLGYVAIAAHVKVTNTNLAVPELFQKMFPHWFVGIAFSAIAIGALVPAAIMSIAAANLFTRNVWVQYFDRDATPEREAAVARIVSLLVKIGAVIFVVLLSGQFSVNLQLLHFKAYHGLIALAINLIVVCVGSLILNALRAPKGEDVTRPEDFDEVTTTALPPVDIGQPQAA